MAGTLYVVSTPIGNLGDFSPRAQEVLSQVDFIAAEDTRVGAKLLNKFGIKKPQISYFEHNRKAKGQLIAQRILAGEDCALITDAGTPAISDPGCDLVDICLGEGIQVVAVPGPCALIAALSIAGMDCGRFCFEGFLSVNKKSRREHLEDIREEKRTLEDFYKTLGERPIALVREITKVHEQVWRTTLSEAIAHYTQEPPRGEFVLILGGKQEEEEQAPAIDPMDRVGELLEEGLSISLAVKQTAKELGVPKNSIYNEALERFSQKE